MSEFDPVAYLASKGLRGRSVSGGREYVYPCFAACEEPPNSKKQKLYLNAHDAWWHCKVCDSAGGSYALQKQFGDEPRAGTTDDAFLRTRILDAAQALGTAVLMRNDDVLLYLMKDRGLTAETIEARKLGFIAGGWSLVESISGDYTKDQLRSTGLVHRDGSREGRDFFYRHLLIPYTSHGHVIQMRGRVWGESKGGRYLTGPGEVPRLFNADSLHGADEVIITEGEFDAMILAQSLAEGDARARKIAVVAIPGTGALPDELEDALSALKRIYIGLDSDEPGQRAAEKLKEMLGERARILALPAEEGRKVDWTEYLLPAATTEHPDAGHGWRDVMRLLSTATGRRLASFGEARQAYEAYRLINTGFKTGYSQLDASISPGLLPGQVLIALAKTGTGKTLWLCNLAYQMRATPQLFISLEMTREEIYDRLRRIVLFHHPDYTDDDVEDAMTNVWICDENRLAERDISALVSEFTVETGVKPELVFVDYLGYFARGARGNSPYEKLSNAVMTLKEEAKASRVVIVSPSQVNRGAKEGKPIDLDDARDSGAIEETADFLLALYRPDENLSLESISNDGSQSQQKPSGKLRMSILKSRHGGRGNVCSLQMDLLTLAIVDDNTPAARRADEHNYLAWTGSDWEAMRRAETRPRQMLLIKGGSDA